MTSYSSVFGNSTILPSAVGLFALTLSAADVTLEWLLESNAPEYPAAGILDVTSANSRAITLPDATLASTGQSILFNNLSASTSSFTIKDAAGSTLATVTAGTQWLLYLADNSTEAGVWRASQMGASTATVQAAALAGNGLGVLSNQLVQAMSLSEINASQSVATTDRARGFVWIASGAGTLSLVAAASAGNDFFFAVNNAGGGALTLDPNGSETIDNATSLTLQPGESTFVACSGTEWYTFGLGQEAVFAFDYVTISLDGLSGNYTLSGSELNRVAYNFTGALAGNIEIVVPPTVQQYWIGNATTGAYTLGAKVSGGTAVSVVQGARAILFCNGSAVVDADTSSVATPISVANGGTGLSTYTIGDLLYASATGTLSKLAGVATGNALISGGVGTAPSWGKVGLTTHVSGTLPVANGGTGITSLGSGVATWLGTPTAANFAAATTGAANGQMLIGNGTNFSVATLTAGSGISITNGAGTVTIAAAGWTQIGSTLTPSGSASASFTSIPQTYGALLIDIAAISHNGGASQALQIEVSDDGTNWSTAVAVSGSLTGASSNYGGFYIPGYTFPAGSFSGAANSFVPTRAVTGAGSPSEVLLWRLDGGGITAIRFTWAAGANFDAGTFKLYGR